MLNARRQSPSFTTYCLAFNSIDKCQLPDVAVSRIISGRDAKPGQFPWQVAMYVNGHFSCGGSILKPDWLITAAHCFGGLQPSHNITFVAGRDLENKYIRKKFDISRKLTAPGLYYGRLL